MNGEPVDPVATRSRVAYVMQEDALMATATPRETLAFALALRHRVGLGPEDRDALVATVLKELGLEDCADTLVGGHAFKGITQPP